MLFHKFLPLIGNLTLPSLEVILDSDIESPSYEEMNERHGR